MKSVGHVQAQLTFPFRDEDVADMRMNKSERNVASLSQAPVAPPGV